MEWCIQLKHFTFTVERPSTLKPVIPHSTRDIPLHSPHILKNYLYQTNFYLSPRFLRASHRSMLRLCSWLYRKISSVWITSWRTGNMRSAEPHMKQSSMPYVEGSKGNLKNNWNAEGETGTFPQICTLYKLVIFTNQHCSTNRYCLLTEIFGSQVGKVGYFQHF